jgi:hypothetical protein
MIIAAREDELAFVPDDLGAQMKITSGQAVAHNTGKQAGMPDIGNVAREQCPGLAPVRLVCPSSEHLAQIAA